MLLPLLQRYSLKLIFALTLLIGLQFPHFLAQYETRLDAHYLESKAQLNQYQKLADFLFDGDLNALVEKHRNSEVALFKAETEIIEKLILRAEFLKNQKINLQGALLSRFVFLTTQVNQPLFIETQENYQANIVLNQQSIIVGLILATLATLLLELMFFCLPILVKRITLYLQRKSIN